MQIDFDLSKLNLNNTLYGEYGDGICAINSIDHIHYTEVEDEDVIGYPKLLKSAEFTASCSSVNTDVINQLCDVKNPTYTVEGTIQHIQKRRHKKRRINKKWAKRYGYTEVCVRGVVNPGSIQIDAYSTGDQTQTTFEMNDVQMFVR